MLVNKLFTASLCFDSHFFTRQRLHKSQQHRTALLIFPKAARNIFIFTVELLSVQQTGSVRDVASGKKKCSFTTALLSV